MNVFFTTQQKTEKQDNAFMYTTRFFQQLLSDIVVDSLFPLICLYDLNQWIQYSVTLSDVEVVKHVSNKLLLIWFPVVGMYNNLYF